MIKNALIRGIRSFTNAVVINVILAIIIMVAVGDPDFVPLVPDYAAHFNSKVVALLAQIVLIGITSAAFGAGSVILEIERLSLVKQSVIYFILTTAVWIPVSVFCWRIDKYTMAFIGIICSYIISYVVSWILQYHMCKKSVEKINKKLLQMKLDESEIE